MITTFLISCLFQLNLKPTDDSVRNFQRQLIDIVYSFVRYPDEVLSGDTCYHYTELLKVEIDKSSKVTSIEFSDSAPLWIMKDMRMQMKNISKYLPALDSLARKAKLRNCIFVFPVLIESDDFPCGVASKKREMKENYFQFNGKYLKGNLIFGEQETMTYSTRYSH